MTIRQQLLLEIETAKMRHAWAKAEVRRGEPSPALVKYLQESLQELRTLTSLVFRVAKHQTTAELNLRSWGFGLATVLGGVLIEGKARLRQYRAKRFGSLSSFVVLFMV